MKNILDEPIKLPVEQEQPMTPHFTFLLAVPMWLFMWTCELELHSFASFMSCIGLYLLFMVLVQPAVQEEYPSVMGTLCVLIGVGLLAFNSFLLWGHYREWLMELL
jgi:hypothetical protein